MKIKKYIHCVILILFFAGIHEGKIAIWNDEKPQPIMILPYSVELLPEKDRITLENGITINSRKELTGFLEDFCS